MASTITLPDVDGAITDRQLRACLVALKNDVESLQGGNGILAAEIAIADTGNQFTGTDVEAALSECTTAANLVATTSGKGAALVGLIDATTQTSAVTVEAAIAELYANRGGQGIYTKATNGVQTPIAAHADSRVVKIQVLCTESFSNGDGAKPTFTIGETGSATKFTDGTDIGGMSAGDKLEYMDTLTATKALIVTATAGTGSTETGAITVTAIACRI